MTDDGGSDRSYKLRKMLKEMDKEKEKRKKEKSRTKR